MSYPSKGVIHLNRLLQKCKEWHAMAIKHTLAKRTKLIEKIPFTVREFDQVTGSFKVVSWAGLNSKHVLNQMEMLHTWWASLHHVEVVFPWKADKTGHIMVLYVNIVWPQPPCIRGEGDGLKFSCLHFHAPTVDQHLARLLGLSSRAGEISTK